MGVPINFVCSSPRLCQPFCAVLWPFDIPLFLAFSDHLGQLRGDCFLVFGSSVWCREPVSSCGCCLVDAYFFGSVVSG